MSRFDRAASARCCCVKSAKPKPRSAGCARTPRDGELVSPVAVLELDQYFETFRRHPGRQRRFAVARGRRGRRPDGRQRRRQVDAGQDDRRQLSARATAPCAWTARNSCCTGRSKPRQHGIEIVHQDLALCNNLTAAANVFLGRETASRRRPVPHSRLCRHVPARRASSSRS